MSARSGAPAVRLGLAVLLAGGSVFPATTGSAAAPGPAPESPSPSAPPGLIAVVGGRVLPVSRPPLEEATVLIRDGKIEAVGRNVRIPPDARRIDASGMWVLPGLIDSRTHLGLWEVDLSPVTRDEDEKSDPITPQLRVTDAFYDESANIPITRETGVAAALVAPGESNLINGQSGIVDLSGRRLDEVLVRFPVAMHFSLGEPPKARYSERTVSPSTRMGSAALIRTALIQAREYETKRAEYEKKLAACGTGSASGSRRAKAKKIDSCPPDPPARDLRLESLVPVVKGELPAIFRAHRMDDILTAVRLAEEFRLRLILSHAAEAYKVADLLAAKKIPVLVGPITTQPDRIETRGAIYENAALLARAGVKLAIQTGATNDARSLPWEAGLAVAYGLPWDEALRAITIHPAEILGVAERLGSLDPGKDATLIVTTGDPLQPLTHVKHLLIRGRDVSLRTRQDDLAEKYR
jgi:imidazolonepropionase-like amidohydrolase